MFQGIYFLTKNIIIFLFFSPCSVKNVFTGYSFNNLLFNHGKADIDYINKKTSCHLYCIHSVHIWDGLIFFCKPKTGNCNNTHTIFALIINTELDEATLKILRHNMVKYFKFKCFTPSQFKIDRNIIKILKLN